MEQSGEIGIYSEVGRLKRVLVHSPGSEIEHITPDLMKKLLFDEIPYLKVAREEHRKFVDVLRENGSEVIELSDAIAEIIKDAALKETFIDSFLQSSMISGKGKMLALKDYLLGIGDALTLVNKMMTGIFNKEIAHSDFLSFGDVFEEDTPFATAPMPNLYFTRDPSSVIGRGRSINCMNHKIRKRESIFTDLLFEHHPAFGKLSSPIYYEKKENASIEGGDILVLSDRVLLIGISERTEPLGIERLAENIFSSDENFDTVLAMKIPNKRAFMHLDTVFTMLDRNSFIIHNEIESSLKVYSIQKKEDGTLAYRDEGKLLKEILERYLGLNEVRLIQCGGGDSIIAPREQWSDGANTLAIAPGELIVYERNYVSNRILEEAGMKLHKIPSSELSRGRGGPRCMSMPLLRER